MKSYLALIAVALWTSSVRGGVILNAPGFGAAPVFQNAPGIIPAPQEDVALAPHPAVVQNAIAESQLPPELLNPFYKNPAIAAGLAKESWFINKEFPVHHREAEKISRAEIYKIVSRIQSVQRKR